MSSKKRLGRRTFAKTLGLSALALPFLRALPSQAQVDAPKRFIFMFSPNGTVPDAWGADGGERDFTLRRILAPLESFREQLLVLEGVDQRSAREGPGDGHQTGMGHLLTGRVLLPGDTMGGCDSCPPASWASGISVDQRIANHVGDGTRFRSLELGVKVGRAANVWSRMSYQGAAQPLPPEDDPYAVYDRVFGDLVADPFGLERRRALRQSVLDFVQEDFSRLRANLGRADRDVLDSHAEAVRDIERRLDSPGAVGAACAAPTMGERLDKDATENYPAVGRLQMDLLVMAMACDLTRVGTLQWSRSVGGVPSPWLGIEDRHHDLSHEGDGNSDAKEKLVRINTWYAEQYAYLLGRLASIPEGEGSMLDNTLVLWGNELGKGNSHTRNDIPFVLGGNVDGHFSTGRFLRFEARPHNDLLTTVAQAYGVEDETFGAPEFNTGPISELLS